MTVTGEAPLVETSHATLGIVIDEKKVVELPLNGRNFTQLGTLHPRRGRPAGRPGRVAGDATPGGFGATTSGFSVNGMRNQSNNFLLDGATNNDTFNTGFVVRPPPDAIQEFKILTHSYSAEYGRSAGSVVNVVTKSGTNAFHGGAWEFNRDDALQARNFFAPAGPAQAEAEAEPVRRSARRAGRPQPVVRVRVLRRPSQHQRRHARTSSCSATRSGAATSAATTIRDPLTGLPFPNNVIPGRPDRPGRRPADRTTSCPRANTGGNRYVASPDTTDDRDQFGARLDYQHQRRQLAAGRYIRSETARGAAGDRPAPIGTDAERHAAGLHGRRTRYVFSPERDQPGARLLQPDRRQSRRRPADC